MLSTAYMTLKHAWNVKSYYAVAPSSFPHRMGCTNSDMFRLTLPIHTYVNGISLADYHAAFLLSPIFQLELWLLAKAGVADPTTTTETHLRAVASGDRQSFAAWRTRAVKGNIHENIVCSSKSGQPTPYIAVSSTATTTHAPSDSIKTAPCIIMRSVMDGEKPFCDTWWAVELVKNDDIDSNSHPTKVWRTELVFGTALIGPNADSTIIRWMTPFHRLYSRLLLGSCAVQLIRDKQKQRMQ